MTSHRPRLPAIAHALRSPFVPEAFEALARCDGYLDVVWAQLAPSVETAGFRDSALYLADMALDAAAAELEPAEASAALLDPIVSTLDAFQWVTPQTLLVCAALLEATERPRVGGEGRTEPRLTLPREAAHLATSIVLASPDVPPLPAIAAALQVRDAPDLYRALASIPSSAADDVSVVERAWSETQHLAALPTLRRRGRALYYYARSAARFLAYPLTADAEALGAAGLAPDARAAAREVLADAVPATATMLMHIAALRVRLGLTERRVSGGDPAR